MLQREGGLYFEDGVKCGARGDVEGSNADVDKAREEVKAPAEGY